MSLIEILKFHPAGGIRERYWSDKHNLRQGEYKSFDVNGELAELATYIDGYRQGEYKWWVSGRLVFYATYRNNELHGEVRVWYDSGAYEGCAFYCNGVNITREVVPYADNPVMIALKFGIPMLSDRSLCPVSAKFIYD